MTMSLTQNDLEMIGLKAGEAAHKAFSERLDDLKRMMREEAHQIVQSHKASCPVKADVAEAKVGIRKLILLVVGSSLGGGAVSRLPDIVAFLEKLR